MNNDKENNYNNENSGCGCGNFIGYSILVFGLVVIILSVFTGIQTVFTGIQKHQKTLQNTSSKIKSGVVNFIDPCPSYDKGEVTSLKIPKEAYLKFYQDRRRIDRIMIYEKDHCEKTVQITIPDVLYLLQNFTGSVKVKITQVTGVYSYIGHVIAIKEIPK